jgi:3alpha(or 20beta)-hydroxysteroid dehydrogenase
VRLDVTSEADWEGAVATAVGRFGRLDVLVNNAGVGGGSLLEHTTAAAWDHGMDVNAKGVFLGTKAAIPAMRRSGGGSIVNISSLAGVRGFFGHGSYSASKFGVRGVTQVAAVELGPHDIRVNSVHPGMVDTAMLPPDRDGTRSTRLQQVPLGRVGTTDDVASLALFLASDESSYMTGAELVIDGGSAAGRPVVRTT